MANETLSPKQAQQIITSADEIMTRAISEIEQKNNDFIEAVSRVWEDKNAVDYIKKHGENMFKVQEELQKNAKTFAETVKSIADAYAAVGGNPISIATSLTLSPKQLLVGHVKETFDGDEFGFKNPDAGAQQVMDAFATLKASLQGIMVEATDRLKSINAFGNEEVKANIAVSSGKIVEIVREHMDQAEASIRDYVDQTAQAYVKTGSNAATAANLQKGE